MTNEKRKTTQPGFEFGMVNLQSENQSGGRTPAPKAGSATATPEDMLFGASEVVPELETPITGDAESFAPVRESWESASQWSQGAEDVISSAMASPPPEPLVAQTAPQVKKTAPAQKAPRGQQGHPPAMPQARRPTGVFKSGTIGAPTQAQLASRRPRSGQAGKILALSLAAAGLCGGAWLQLGPGSLPLAIVSAGLGIVGGVFVYILTKR